MSWWLHAGHRKVLCVALGLLASCKAQEHCPPPAVPKERAAAPVGTVIAHISGKPLTARDVSRLLARQAPYVRQRAGTPQGKRAFVERLIRRRLLAAEARRRGLHRDPALRDRMDQLLADHLLTDLRAKLLKPSDISDADVEAFYRKNTALYLQPAKVRVRQLVVAKQAEARRLLALARRRGDERSFIELVAQHSIDGPSKLRGGDLGYLAAKDPRWPAALVDAALALPRVGAVGGPVKISAGHAVLLKTAEQAAIRRPLSEEAPQIRQRLLASRRLDAVRAFVARLRQRARVRLTAETLAKVRIP